MAAGRGGGRGRGKGGSGELKAGASVKLSAEQASALEKLGKKQSKKDKRKQDRKTERTVVKHLRKHGVEADSNSSSSDSDASSLSDSDSSSEDAKKKKKKAKKRKAAKLRRKERYKELEKSHEQSKQEIERLKADKGELELKAKEYAEVDKGVREKVAPSDEKEGVASETVAVTLEAWEKIKSEAKLRSNPPSPAKTYGIFAKFCAPETCATGESSSSEGTAALATMFDEKCELADAKQSLSSGVSVTDAAEKQLSIWAKQIVSFYKLDPSGLKDLQAVKRKWLPKNQATLPDTVVKTLLRALCSRGIPIHQEELGGCSLDGV